MALACQSAVFQFGWRRHCRDHVYRVPRTPQVYIKLVSPTQTLDTTLLRGGGRSYIAWEHGYNPYGCENSFFEQRHYHTALTTSTTSTASHSIDVSIAEKFQ